PRIADNRLSRVLRGRFLVLIHNEAKTTAIELAYIHSVERAVSAANAHSETWVIRQDRTAARYESRLPSLLAVERRLRLRLSSALKKTRLARVRPSASAIARARKGLSRGLPVRDRGLLARFGFTGGQQQALAQQIAHAHAHPQPLIDTITDPAVTHAMTAASQASAGDAYMAACVTSGT
ncbi:MAG: hypothetical protein ACYCXW_21640, partial [Solirubrobacteraceae bacterium]